MAMMRFWLCILLSFSLLVPVWAEPLEPTASAPVRADATAVVVTTAIPVKPDEGLRLKEEIQRADGTSMGSASLQMVVGLLAVLAVIFSLSWLARRLNLAVPGAAVNMKVVSALSVGQKEKILLVEVENRRLLLGVTPQQISVLQEMGEAPPKVADGDFANRMQALLKAGSVNEK